MHLAPPEVTVYVLASVAATSGTGDQCEVLIKPRQPQRRGRLSVADQVSRCPRPIGKLKEQGGLAITGDC
ncbi:hypothetical protein GQ600_9019 [Phytophthora cactorum]|nr:hypothetical protein GQ600_9019 [Phytophthora cactorum]